MIDWYWWTGGGLLLVVAVVLAMRWRESIIVSIAGWLLIAVIVGCLTSVTLLMLLGWPSLPKSSSFTTPETLDLLKIALSVVAGFGGVVILSVNHRKQLFAEKAHRLAEKQDVREGGKLQNERFVAAAEQMAHESPHVRLAGVYSLTGLADDWDAGRQKCVEVLISYLRLVEPEGRASSAGEDEVVRTILRTFRERLLRGAYSRWRELDFDFTGISFSNADFSGLHFKGSAIFDGATFSGDETSFAETWFEGILSCHGTTFAAERTDFRRVWFDGPAEFVGATFGDLFDLRGAWVDMGTVDFYRCRFEGAVNGADLEVDPGAVQFERCLFSGTFVNLDWARVGPYGDERRLLGLIVVRDITGKIPRISIKDCELAACTLTLRNVSLANGRMVLADLKLKHSKLLFESTEVSHPSLVVRRIEAYQSTIDVPVPKRIWAQAISTDEPAKPAGSSNP